MPAALVYLLLLIPITATAQWEERPRDTLLARLDTTRSDLERAVLLSQLAGSWMVSDKGMPYLERLDTLLHRLEHAPDPEVRSHARNLRINFIYQLGYKRKFKRRFPEALQLFQQATDSLRARHDTSSVVNLLDAVGTLYRALGEPSVAFRQYADALRLRQQCRTQPVHRSEAGIRIHMAQCLTDQGRTREALRMLVGLDTTAAEDFAHQLLEEARIAMQDGDLDHALVRARKADVVVQRWHYSWNRISTLAALARIHQKRLDHHASLQAANQCVDIAAELGDEAAECGCRVLAGEARIQLGDAAGAEHDLRAAIGIAHAYGYVGLARESGDEGSVVHATALLRDLLRRQGRLADAMALTDQWVQLRDSLERLSGRGLLVLEDLRWRLRTDSLEHALELERVDRMKREDLAREQERTRWAMATGALGMLGLGTIILLVSQRRRRDRRIAALDLQRLQQESTIAEYRIREQLGRDLHDDLGVGLGAMKLKSELAQMQVGNDHARAAMAELADLSNELLVNMRQIIWALDDAQGSLSDTVAHCLNHARRYLAEHGIAIEVDVPERLSDTQLPAIIRRNLFLIVKEALHNVVKHAEADRVRIAFSTTTNQLLLVVADNGKGLSQVRDGLRGHGLSNMRKRAAAMRGELTITSTVGTELWCSIPLPHNLRVIA